MKHLTYLACVVFVSGLVAAMIGWSVAAGNFLVPVISIPLGIIVVLACRSNVTTIISDERENKIRSRAALRTMEVFVITGAIIAIILYSYIASAPLSPVITGKIINNGNGSTTMIITEYMPGGALVPGNIVRSTTIHDLNAMNESEAMAYCSFVRESYKENESRGLVGMTLGASMLALIGIYGIFYLYYRKKY